MALLPIKKATLVEKLVAEVRREITSGRLVVGQSLPTEAKMAAQFGVSRPLLREALAELRAEGFVDTISGRGTFVRHPTETDLADAFAHQLLLATSGPGPTADQLYEARQAIEVVAAELAAQRATPEALETLERLLATMTESRDDAAAYTAADVGFHIAVARATLQPAAADAAGPPGQPDRQGHVREPQHARRRFARDHRPHERAARPEEARPCGRQASDGRPPARVEAGLPRAAGAPGRRSSPPF